MDNLQSMVDDYMACQSALSEREKAVREKGIWEAALSSGSAGRDERAKWMAAMLGGSTSPYRQRQILLSTGHGVEPLWERVEREEMLLHTAAELVTQARKLVAERRISTTEAVTEALRGYDARPFARLVNGRLVRAGSPGGKSVEPPAAPEPAPPSEPPPRPAPDADTGERAFWASMREQITDHAKERLAGEDPLFVHTAVERFLMGLRALIIEHQIVLNATRRDSAQRRVIGKDALRKKMLSALAVLHVDPPGRGEPVNIGKARSKKNRLVGEYHPDIPGTGNRARFEAVIEAFRVVEQWVETYESQGKKTA